MPSTLAVGDRGLPVKTLRLQVLTGSEPGLTVFGGADSMTVGSAPGLALTLHDPTVSRYHTEISRKDDGIWVRDLGSTNGTLAGQIHLNYARVPAGTQLSLGRSMIRVDDGEPLTVELFADSRLGGLYGRSSAMRRLMARLDRVAPAQTSVLLLGETGVGKEVCARAIHDRSPRAEKPFEIVDCGAVLPTLVASELFGHEKGAFTGAEAQHIGAFERANGGTLFIDEIGELPGPLQTALLGALERRQIRRLGGKNTIPVDVRLVAATNRDLRAEINQGTFRLDLYHRLAVVSLEIPPLRERVEDIPLLVQHFLLRAGHGGQVEDVIPAHVMQQLQQHRWPGNVRELRNLVEAALVMGETPPLYSPGTAATAEYPGGQPSAWLNFPYNEARAHAIEDFEATYVRHLLAQTDGNISEAAKKAVMDRSYFMRIMKRHGIRTEKVVT